MDALFTTDIIIDGESKGFNVIFKNGAYEFLPLEQNGTPAFSIRREDDVWKPNSSLNDIAQQQAITALERYLLSQH